MFIHNYPFDLKTASNNEATGYPVVLLTAMRVVHTLLGDHRKKKNTRSLAQTVFFLFLWMFESALVNREDDWYPRAQVLASKSVKVLSGWTKVVKS